MSDLDGAHWLALGRRTLRRGWYDLKTVVAPYPVLAIPAARRRHGAPVERDTQIVIEGFPRTANTFAVVAFTMAQPEPVRVAAHVHAPAQLIAAAARGIPAIALIREPEPTILSFAIRHPEIGVRHGLRGYVRFYEPLLRYRDRLVVGRFSEVTTDFGAVIRRVNERFGTSFGIFEHTEANVRRSFDEIDRGYAGREDRGAGFESIVPRPSEHRETVKETLRSEYRSSRSATMRDRAEAAYRAFAAAGGSAETSDR
jgi:hypothetical protein